MFSKKYWVQNWKQVAIAAAFVVGGYALLTAAVGCNTVAGLGEDIQRTSIGVRDAMADN